MQSNFLFELLKEYTPYSQVEKAINGKNKIISCVNLSGAMKAHLISSLAVNTNRPVLYVCASEKAALAAIEDFSSLIGNQIALFPARDFTFYQDISSSRESVHRRIDTLYKILSGKLRIVIVAADALMHRVMPKEQFEKSIIHFSVGDRLAIEDLTVQLLRIGYSREYMVEGKGQFAVRGGIVDVFSPSMSHAVRIEFFDDEIDSIRSFSPIEQRSIENLREVRLTPACESVLDEDRVSAVVGYIRSAFKNKDGQTAIVNPGEDAETDETSGESAEFLPERYNIEKYRQYLHTGDNAGDRFYQRMITAVEDAESGISNRILEKYMNLVFEKQETIADYMSNPLVVMDEMIAIEERMNSRENEFIHAYTGALERGEALTVQEHLLYRKDELFDRFRQSMLLMLSGIERSSEQILPDYTVDMNGLSLGNYNGRSRELCIDARKWLDKRWRILIMAGGTARSERIHQSLTDEGIPSRLDAQCERGSAPGEISIYPLSISSSFAYPDISLVVVSQSDVYGSKASRVRIKRQEGSRLSAFSDLDEGDYVVHELYGIGIYQGIEKISRNGVSRDYLRIKYSGEDSLFIPVDQFDQVQKYIGAGEGTVPKLSILGGGNWRKQKNKVRESLKKLAFDLVALYAERQKNVGHAFSQDTPWQMEFEENFPFDETEDQLTATNEIKLDMEKEQAMDRLLCGDVGYGKTEVALRAAFKAIMDGYQVAILAPTTILVQQHFQTIQRRFEGFPVKIDYLSRFKTQKEQRETLKKLADGELDLVIGTHRMLNKAVEFKKLGLLVVDEEQRFGVGHKETIKNVHKNVDVLTLSATPIPRTLHMSMVGIRDISLLETPPQERIPVQTFVMEYSDSVIRDAVLREIERGGQVFFLYNRVEFINDRFAALQRLIPEARIAVAHGQMKENALEDIMMDFSLQKYDVLLCTTIIESGLDIPTVNTLIVYDADHFGLGQLYQIRGRVGRSNRQAYAYLTIRPQKTITEQAQKRLDTIKEFTEFGSGFRIAMRDLELRGAGNILGAQQSGHLAEIGYDLYCKLLDEAVQEAKGMEVKTSHEMETRMIMQVDAYLPTNYVTGEKLRLEIYKKIAAVSSSEHRDDLEEELVDRFGDEPQCVANLVAVAFLKSICSKLGILRVNQTSGMIQMTLSPTTGMDMVTLIKAVNTTDNRLTMNIEGGVTLTVKDSRMNHTDMLHLTLRIMERLVEAIRSIREQVSGE